MYAAVYRAIKPVFGGAVRIAVSGGNSNFTRDVLTELRGEPGVEVDMLDVHIYPDQPSAIPWRIYVRPLWPAFRTPSRTLCPSCRHPHAERCALVETVEQGG